MGDWMDDKEQAEMDDMHHQEELKAQKEEIKEELCNWLEERSGWFTIDELIDKIKSL